jgi:hypothetical protein
MVIPNPRDASGHVLKSGMLARVTLAVAVPTVTGALGMSRSLPRTTTCWPSCKFPRTWISAPSATPNWTGTAAAIVFPD